MIFFAYGAGIRQGDNPRGSLSRTGRDMDELELATFLASADADYIVAQTYNIDGGNLMS
jgi:hypothetical protein